MAATKLHGPDVGLSYQEATEPTRGVVAAAEPLPPPQVPPAQAGAAATPGQVFMIEGIQCLGVSWRVLLPVCLPLSSHRAMAMLRFGDSWQRRSCAPGPACLLRQDLLPNLL